MWFSSQLWDNSCTHCTNCLFSGGSILHRTNNAAGLSSQEADESDEEGNNREPLDVKQNISLHNLFPIEEVQEFDMYQDETVSESNID